MWTTKQTEYKMQIWDIKAKLLGEAGQMSQLVTYNLPEKNITEIMSKWRHNFIEDAGSNEFYFPDYNPKGTGNQLFVNKVSIISSSNKNSSTLNVENLTMSIQHIFDFVGQHSHISATGKAVKSNYSGGLLYQDFMVHQNLLFLAHGMFVTIVDINKPNKSSTHQHLRLFERTNWKNGGTRKSCYKMDPDV